MTQRKLAGGYIRGYLSGEGDPIDLLWRMTALIDAAQNAPPLGGADGSLDESQWTALRDFRDAVVNVELKTRGVLDALGLDEEGNTRR